MTLLVNHGINLDSPTGNMMNWQIHVLKENNVQLIKLLILQSGSLLVSEEFSHLFLGAEDGCREMVQYLIDHCGCNINDPLPYHCYWPSNAVHNWNLLLEACDVVKVEAVEFLLQNGADPQCPGIEDTAIAWIFYYGGNCSAYSQEAKRIVEVLLDHGANINGDKSSPEEAEKFPRTLESSIYCAVDKRDLPMVEFLISRGVDVNATSGSETPLHLARREGSNDIISLMMRHEPSTDVTIPIYI